MASIQLPPIGRPARRSVTLHYLGLWWSHLPEADKAVLTGTAIVMVLALIPLGWLAMTLSRT